MRRAWALWVLSSQSFASGLDKAWGYDVSRPTMSKKIRNKVDQFTDSLRDRIRNVQIECTDALRVIKYRYRVDSFFYIDPPYYNSNCGHYDGYTIEDYERLLQQLATLKGKFLLSSYPSPLLATYAQTHGWHQREIVQGISVANNHGQSQKKKVEVLTFNYDLNSD